MQCLQARQIGYCLQIYLVNFCHTKFLTFMDTQAICAWLTIVLKFLIQYHYIGRNPRYYCSFSLRTVSLLGNMLSSKRCAPMLEVKPFLLYRNSSLRVRCWTFTVLVQLQLSCYYLMVMPNTKKILKLAYLIINYYLLINLECVSNVGPIFAIRVQICRWSNKKMQYRTTVII